MHQGFRKVTPHELDIYLIHYTQHLLENNQITVFTYMELAKLVPSKKGIQYMDCNVLETIHILHE